MAKSTGLKPILYITDSTGYGGAEKYLEEVAAHFSRLVQVELLLIGPGCPELEQHMKQLSIPIIRINDGRQSLLRLYKHLLDHRSWLLHANLTYYDSCRHVQLIALTLPMVRMVATLHTLATIDRIDGWKIIKRLARQRAFNRFNVLIAPSQYIRDKLIEERSFPSAKLAVIYNGVEVEPGKDRTTKTNSTPMIVVVARLHPDKGHKYLFDALGRLHKDGKKFRCQVIGEGPLLDELQAQIKELDLAADVQFLGFKNNVSELLQSADILVLPSLPESENFPLTILEAMSAGLPVIATRVGGVPEQVVDGKTGLLVDPGNSEQLAQALSHLVNRPKVARHMGKAGRLRLMAMYTSTNMMDKVGEIYRGNISFGQADP